MQDGKGTLHFVKPQATLKTREQMREDSPSGEVSLAEELDWHGKSLIVLLIIFVLGLAITYTIF